MNLSDEVDKEIRLLAALDPIVRQRAARRLVEIGASKAYFALQYRKAFERHAGTRSVLLTSIRALEERFHREPLEAFLPGMLVTIRPILDSPHSEPADRAAALSTLAFIDQVSAKSSAQKNTVPSPQNAICLSRDLLELIEALRDPREEWRRRAEGMLFLRGSEAIGPLRQAFARTTPLHRGRIAGVLAGIGDIAALPTIWDAWREGLAGEAHISLKTALLRMGAQLPTSYEKIDLEELLIVLSESREHLPPLAEFIAKALVRRAHEKPTPELRRAIPLLKGTWFRPTLPALDRARKAIEVATAAWANLPIASPGPKDHAEDLPVPAESHAGDSSVDLPRPNSEAPR